MTYRRTPLVSGEFFHVYNRGNSKQEIFLNDKDKERFVRLLYLSNSKKKISFRDDIVDKKIDTWDFEREETLVSIGAWVLMPNHFHIYITSPILGVGESVENKRYKTNIALFMNKLCISYAKYFNKKYNRIGVLFEGNFKSLHVENDNQAKYLFSYIHLNPVKLIDSGWKENGISDINTALKYLDTYKWSSYHDHRGILRKESKILELKNFPEYFSNIKDFDSEIFSWLQYK
jgi:putative transposase